jgi:hypothetical protein
MRAGEPEIAAIACTVAVASSSCRSWAIRWTSPVLGRLESRDERRIRYSMTARDALKQATSAQPGERLRRFETVCGPPVPVVASR